MSSRSGTASGRARRLGRRLAESLRVHQTAESLQGTDGHVWSNEDLDPVRLERQNWTPAAFMAFWIAEAFTVSFWNIGSALVSSGLLWWHAVICIILGGLVAAFLITWNGRCGAVYHVGFPIFMRASFGMTGSFVPVLVRALTELVWYGVQTYFGSQFLDLSFQCIFGHSWTNLPNHLPASAGVTSRALLAYFIYWLIQLMTHFFRPDQIKWLWKVKSVIMPITLASIFIWVMVKSGGPTMSRINSTEASGSLLGWSFMGGINTAINGMFGPMISSQADFARYARRPRDQWIGNLSVNTWAGPLVAILGIVSAAGTQKMWGTAYWNLTDLLTRILDDDPKSSTRFLVWLASACLVFGQIGTNVSSNLVPFGCDAMTFAPRYISIVRGQLLCAVLGGWCFVPWKLLASGGSFLTFVTGIGIFTGCLVGIALVEYYALRKGNFWITDLYTSARDGRYWYTLGVNWRAFLAYACGLLAVLPGLAGQLGATDLAVPTNAAAKIYNMGYLMSLVVSGAAHYVINQMAPAKSIPEARKLAFEARAKVPILDGVVRTVDPGVKDGDFIVEEEKSSVV